MQSTQSKPTKHKKWEDMMRREKTVGVTGLCIGIIVLLSIISAFSHHDSGSPEASAAPTNQTTTKPEKAIPASSVPAPELPKPVVPKYTIIGYDTADTIYVVIDPVDLSNDNFKQNVKNIIKDIAAKKGYKEFSASVYDNTDAAEWDYNQSIPNDKADGLAKLAEQAQHLVAMYTGGIDDNAQLSTADSAYTIGWYPSANQTTPNVGKYYVFSEQFKP